MIGNHNTGILKKPCFKWLQNELLLRSLLKHLLEDSVQEPLVPGLSWEWFLTFAGVGSAQRQQQVSSGE